MSLFLKGSECTAECEHELKVTFIVPVVAFVVIADVCRLANTPLCQSSPTSFCLLAYIPDSNPAWVSSHRYTYV